MCQIIIVNQLIRHWLEDWYHWWCNGLYFHNNVYLIFLTKEVFFNGTEIWKIPHSDFCYITPSHGFDDNRSQSTLLMYYRYTAVWTEGQFFRVIHYNLIVRKGYKLKMVIVFMWNTRREQELCSEADFCFRLYCVGVF